MWMVCMYNIIIGLDLSLTHTGVGIVFNGKRGYFSLIPKKLFGVRRLAWIEQRLESFVVSTSICCAVIEGYSFGSVGRGIFNIGELGGIVQLLLYKHNIYTVVIPPAVVKKFCCGKGNASKEVIVAAYNRLRGTDFTLKDNNEVDALLLVEIIYYYLHRDSTLRSYQIEVIDLLEEKCTVLC